MLSTTATELNFYRFLVAVAFAVGRRRVDLHSMSFVTLQRNAQQNTT